MAMLFAITCVSLLWLIGTTSWSILRPDQRTWPPIRRSGIVYRISGVLGPGVNFGILALAVLGWNSFVLDHWARFPAGALMLTVGAYFALAGYFQLGVERSLGYEGELLDSGPYRISRNPQYVGAILSTLGLSVICNSALGLASALLACVWWVLMPFAEEPWLREKLGAPYEEYSARVPRYLPFFWLPKG